MNLKEKQRQLRLRASTEHCTWSLRPEDLTALQDRFLPKLAGFCRFPKACPVNGNWKICLNRCNSEYWNDHNRGVARLMEIIARFIGADESLYRTTGLVHDLDYLQYPHDNKKPGARRLFKIHPMVEVAVLEGLGAPAELLLALMEHAPHTGCKPSGNLSHALIAADNIATFRAAGKEMLLPAATPADLAAQLGKVQFKRIDDVSTTQEHRGGLGTRSLKTLLERR